MCLGEDTFRNLETAGLDEYSFITADKNENWYEIIGRPITLEDVLVALEKQSNGYFFTQNGDIPNEDYSIKKETLRLLYSWIPNKPFSEQSKETKELIGDLILK